MLIGNKKSFAIEYELDKDHGGVWMYGKICYWINNTQVGDYELGTSLRDVLFVMKYLIGDCGNREDCTLCNMSSKEAFSNINESIYGNVAGVNTNQPETPARFDILIPVDVFSQWKVFLIDCVGFSVVLYKNNAEESVRCFRIERSEFDSVIKNLYDALNSLYESLVTA